MRWSQLYHLIQVTSPPGASGQAEVTAGDPGPGRAMCGGRSGAPGVRDRRAGVYPQPRPSRLLRAPFLRLLEGWAALLSVALLASAPVRAGIVVAFRGSGGGWPLPGTSSSSSPLTPWARSCPLCSLAPREGGPTATSDQSSPP